MGKVELESRPTFVRVTFRCASSKAVTESTPKFSGGMNMTVELRISGEGFVSAFQNTDTTAPQKNNILKFSGGVCPWTPANWSLMLNFSNGPTNLYYMNQL